MEENNALKVFIEWENGTHVKERRQCDARPAKGEADVKMEMNNNPN